jgi:hypothetical protein
VKGGEDGLFKLFTETKTGKKFICNSLISIIGKRRKDMKKLIIILFTLAVFLIPFSSVMADKGGTPNENADFGQTVSETAKDGGIGNYYASGGKAFANFGDLNGDGKVNGKDVSDKTKELINWLKKKIGRN